MMVTTTVRCLDGEVDGAVNFRDLGGYAAGSGRVRTGLLFRSGMTHRIGEAGITALVERYGLRTVIDLRSAKELEEEGVAPFAARGVRVHHFSLIDSINTPTEEIRKRFQEMRAGRYDWAASYLRMLRDGGPRFRAVFETLTAPDTLPAVFHCMGGRDRTGVTAALLLAVLGVDRANIAHDYALTGDYLRPHLDKFGRVSTRMQMTAEELSRMLETRHEAMHALFTAVDAEWGSVAGYLASIGVPDAHLRALRAMLLERE